MFAYRTVDGATGEVSEPAGMHAAGVTLEYPMSAAAKGDEVILSSWFTGTVQVIDRKPGATSEQRRCTNLINPVGNCERGSVLIAQVA